MKSPVMNRRKKTAKDQWATWNGQADIHKLLAHPLRLAIYELVSRSGNKGMYVRKLSDEVNKKSKVSQVVLGTYINAFVRVGLFSVQRDGLKKIYTCTTEKYGLRRRKISW